MSKNHPVLSPVLLKWAKKKVHEFQTSFSKCKGVELRLYCLVLGLLFFLALSQTSRAIYIKVPIVALTLATSTHVYQIINQFFKKN
jgi:hypothetical protein